MELCECVTKFRGQYGWTHRDIIKLSHPKSADVGNDGLCYEIGVLCSLLLRYFLVTVVHRFKYIQLNC